MAAALAPFSTLDQLFSWSDGVRLTNLLFLGNALTALSTFWPCHVRTVMGRVPSDGLALWNVFFMREADVGQQMQGAFVLEAREHRAKDDFVRAQECLARGLEEFPHSVALLSGVGVNLLDLRQVPEAREYFQQALAHTGSDQETRCLVLNNIAYADALIGGDALLSEADAFSKEAVENLPWVPAVKGTRGTVLVELGRFEEAMELLRFSMANTDDRRHKALNACSMAIAESRRENLQDSRALLGFARELDSECLLLDRAEAAVSGAFVADANPEN